MKRKCEHISEIDDDVEFETHKLAPGMTSARATAIRFLFIHVFQSPPEDKWASMHLVSQIRKR